MALLFAPLRFVVWTAERVLEAAEGELYDERAIMSELGRLNQRYDQGIIDWEAFAAAEDELMERLQVARGRSEP